MNQRRETGMTMTEQHKKPGGSKCFARLGQGLFGSQVDLVCGLFASACWTVDNTEHGNPCVKQPRNGPLSLSLNQDHFSSMFTRAPLLYISTVVKLLQCKRIQLFVDIEIKYRYCPAFFIKYSCILWTWKWAKEEIKVPTFQSWGCCRMI
jgi:hypothetical protein